MPGADSVIRPARADNNREVTSIDLRGTNSLVITGIALGGVTVLLGLIAGFIAYQTSRQAHLESLTRFNAIIANRLSLELIEQGPDATLTQQANFVLQRWRQIPETEPNAFVCVIGPEATLLAHSKRPKNVGRSVAGVSLPHSGAKIPELIKQERDWVGENVNLAGRRQLAAYTYNPKLGGLIVVHTPASTYEADIRAAALPWAVGFGLSTFCLWPLCLGLMLIAFRRSNRSTLLAQQQLKERYSELEQLYRATPVGLCLMDTELRFVRINEQMAAINGFSVEDHIGRRLGDLIPDVAKQVTAIYQRVINTGTDAIGFEVKREQAAGEDSRDTTRYLRVSYHAVGDGDKVIGVSTVVQDVTNEKLRQLQQQRHQHELAHLSRLNTMGEMVAGIAHEINQPLAAISNFSAACRSALTNDSEQSVETVRTWLDRISDEAIRSGEIIRRIRKFVNKGDQSHTTVNLNRVVDDSLALIETDEKLLDVDIQTGLPDSPVLADANEVQLQQVIVNLVRNACDATENQDDRVVNIEVEAVDDTARIAISDNGVGVPPEQQQELFDAFFTTKADGMGMGLAISKSIVEAHGGSLKLDPSVASGACFVIELPALEMTPAGSGQA